MPKLTKHLPIVDIIDRGAAATDPADVAELARAGVARLDDEDGPDGRLRAEITEFAKGIAGHLSPPAPADPSELPPRPMPQRSY
jgi:hypothetical protein